MNNNVNIKNKKGTRQNFAVTSG